MLFKKNFLTYSIDVEADVDRIVTWSYSLT